MYNVKLTYEQWDRILDIYHSDDHDYLELRSWLYDKFNCTKIDTFSPGVLHLNFKSSEEAVMFILKYG